MVCIYYQYKEYKEGAIRPNATPDLVNLQYFFLARLTWHLLTYGQRADPPFFMFRYESRYLSSHKRVADAIPTQVLFEPSSEVATARFSSVRRKSLTDSLFR